jgi:hypothetical protein
MPSGDCFEIGCQVAIGSRSDAKWRLFRDRMPSGDCFEIGCKVAIGSRSDAKWRLVRDRMPSGDWFEIGCQVATGLTGAWGFKLQKKFIVFFEFRFAFKAICAVFSKTISNG